MLRCSVLYLRWFAIVLVPAACGSEKEAAARCEGVAIDMGACSTPVSASVRTKGGKELCEKTPCEISAAQLDVEAVVTISAPGYVTITRTIEATDQEVSAKLARCIGGR